MAEGKSHEETEGAASLPSSEHDRELAVRATSEFDRGDYDACLATIAKLASTRNDDLKVMHNQAVATYYKSGLVHTDEFKAALTELNSKVSLDEIAALDDVEQCIISYNHAVTLYYAKQYRAAFAILDKLMQFIEPMDESVSRRVVLLMVEVCLCMHQPFKALGVLGFIEKQQFGNGKSSSPDKEDGDSKGGRDTKESAVDIEAWRATVSQYKVRCYLMLKSIKLCKREMKALSGSVQVIPAAFLRSQFEYTRGNHQKAIRILSSVSSQILSPSSGLRGPTHNTAAMYYNNLGLLHFHMRKHNLGAFYLRRALDENRKAVCETRQLDIEHPKPGSSCLSSAALPNIGISRHYELMYNLGVELLHCGQPQTAFDCLLETLQQYQVNPYLWLRLAECCIMVQRPNNDVDRSHTKKMEVVNGSVGSGLHRKLMLGSGVRIDKSSTTSESKAIPMATMEFAAMCLDNALLLLAEHGTTTANQSANSPEASTDQRQMTDSSLVSAPPGNPLKADEVCSLRCSVLACRSYVALHHSDYMVALHCAEKLLRQPRLSGAHRYLAHMYVAESLVALDRIADSIDHLNPDIVTDVSTVFPVEQKTDQDKPDKNGETEYQEQDEVKGARYPWSPNNLSQAKAFMLYNLSATHAIRGEHEKALQHLGKVTQLIGQPLPAQLYYLKIYLELMEGHWKVVHSLLRDHFGHVASGR